MSRLRTAGRACTLLGVGPVSETVVRATLQACAHHRCPAIFIASRNQVDLETLGHGYLMGGMGQAAFVALLEQAAAEAAYAGPLYICRDHGGPWQRNAELDGKLPVAQAMAIARQSFRADIEAGFNYLHIDPTKCPHPHTQDDLVSWTAELIAWCESVRAELGRGEIDYEVGTEDIQGGLTTAETFEAFLGKLTARLAAERLPLPTCVVGQTGTLCRCDRNAGRFDAEGTARLVAIAARFGVGFKEHNGDYLPDEICRMHPQIGVTGMNVAPEFGLVETDALLALAGVESAAVGAALVAAQGEGGHKGRPYGLRQLLLDKTFAASPWRKWMLDDVKTLPRERVESDAATRLLIARVCGHYVYDDPEVKAARAKLVASLDRAHAVEGGAEGFVVARVRGAIERYIRCFGLEGANKWAAG